MNMSIYICMQQTIIFMHYADIITVYITYLDDILIIIQIYHNICIDTRAFYSTLHSVVLFNNDIFSWLHIYTNRNIIDRDDVTQ